MTLYAITGVGHQYVLYAIAAAICFVVFVTLILSPAVSSYGRVWEKAAAGFMACFVLAALIVIGVVIGLSIVRYYPEILEFFEGF
jgi:hypothetical protein